MGINILNSIYNLFTNLISPPQCCHCKKYLQERTVFCSDCFKKIKPIVSKTVQLTATKTAQVFAVSDYQEPLRSLVLAKNYENRVASRQLGQLIWDITYLKNIPFDYLVPTPLHWTRYASRGFNQAHEIAQVLSQKSGKPVAPLVRRAAKTAFQFKLTAEERAQNVKDVFVLNEHIDGALYKDKHLVLIDDLFTTGSTARGAAKELLKLKPASITLVVACRVV